MLTVINAWNQQGWSNRDHMMSDDITVMIGKTYSDLHRLKAVAEMLSDSYPIVEYHDGRKRWRYDGSPSIPGRQRSVLTELGDY